MANVYADRVRETTATTGTGTYNLAGAVTGFQTFVAGVATTNTCFYCVDDGTDWEVGQGTVTDAAPDTLSRDEILASSTGSAINWGAGTKKVFAVIPAQCAPLFDASGILYIGDFASVNTKMTVGLTINQGANDDEILALKSSDVAHGITAGTDTDTFGSLEKASAASGGLEVRGWKSAAGNASEALSLVGSLGEAAEETDTTSSLGVISIDAQVKSGTGVTNLATAGNLLTVRNNTTTRFLIKGDGTLHVTNITSGQLDGVDLAVDHEDDVGILRVFERERSQGMGIIMSKWDDAIKANEDDLKRVGILSSDGSFYNVQRMNSFIGGAIWQIHTRLMETQERLALTERRLAPLLN